MALLAVEIIDVAIEVSGDVLAPYLIERISSLIERLGDSKQSVRDATIQLIAALANTPHCSPQVQYFCSSLYHCGVFLIKQSKRYEKIA